MKDAHARPLSSFLRAVVTSDASDGILIPDGANALRSSTSVWWNLGSGASGLVDRRSSIHRSTPARVVTPMQSQNTVNLEARSRRGSGIQPGAAGQPPAQPPSPEDALDACDDSNRSPLPGLSRCGSGSARSCWPQVRRPSPETRAKAPCPPHRLIASAGPSAVAAGGAARR